MDSTRRIGLLRERLATDDVDAFIALAPANVRYLTGFDDVFDEEPSSIVVVTPERTVLFTDSRFETAAGSAAADTDWELVISAGDPFEAFSASEVATAVDRLAAESSMTHRRFTRLEDLFHGEVLAADRWVEQLRIVKEPAELARIAAAQELTDEAFAHIVSFATAGMTERDIALELEFFMRRSGSEGVAFAPIVASGPNSALPHAGVTDRVVERGDLLKLDFGARVGGYCADMTRTVVFGGASEEQRAIYDAVLEANAAGISALAAGLTGREVDAAARAVIEAAGYGDRFGHGLGHGVGLEVHELPSVGRQGDEVLPAGAVVTIEPGIYVPGFGGVRIEDLAVVEAHGSSVMTRSPKELIAL